MPQVIATPQEQTMLEEGTALPVAYCLPCHKEVVVYAALGEGPRDGVLLWRCLFCDEETLSEEDGLKEVSATDLTERGYRVVAPEAAKLHKEGGVSDGDEEGGGCGSCSTGCSSSE